jgi:hypothetical protein
MKIVKLIEEFSSHRMRIELLSGLAAGLCAAGIISLVYALKHPFNLIAYARFVVMGVTAYLAIAALTYRFWRGSLRRMLSSCVLIAVLGSILFATIRLLPGVMEGWTPAQSSSIPLTQYISTEITAALGFVFVLILATLPVAALFQYAGHIVRATRDWHNGPVPLNILDGSKTERPLHLTRENDRSKPCGGL